MIARVVLYNWRIGLPLLALTAFACLRATAADSVTSTDSARPESSFRHGDWPFAPPLRPVVPESGADVQTRNAIDHFMIGLRGGRSESECEFIKSEFKQAIAAP